MQLLNAHEKWKIGLTSLAVAGVSLGSVLLLSKNLFHDTEAQQKDNASDQPVSFAAREELKSPASQPGHEL